MKGGKKVEEETKKPCTPVEERMNRRILWALLIETIGTVVFNVGWWMDWPPMVLFGVLLAVTGLDLWDEK